MSCPKLVVLWAVSHNSLDMSSTVSDRPQRMPEGHTWPVNRTAERADNRRRSTDAQVKSWYRSPLNGQLTIYPV